jgi:D-lactate dehydrogenase
MKIALFNSKSYDREYFDRFNQSTDHDITYYDAPLNRDTVNLVQGFEAVCVFVNDKIDRPVLKKLLEYEIKLVALRCAGFNNVELEAAKELGITVVRVPAYSPEAVAEHAVALILTLNRKTHKAYNRIRENNFSLEKLTGFNLNGKTVGVVGTGQIGAAFCRIMLGFGCNVIATDIKESRDLIESGVIYKPFDDLLATSDIISLHCPLTSETHHLFNRKAFRKMKKGSMLINTGRGALINTRDAIDALKSEKLGHLGMDVYEQEEKLFFRDLSEMIIPDDLIARLMSFHNVLITAHQGFFTREALEQIATITLQNISDFEMGKALKHAVNV